MTSKAKLMNKEYYYLSEEREAAGPVSEQVIAQMLSDGNLTAESELALVGAEEWHSLQELLPDLVKNDSAGEVTNASEAGDTELSLVDKLTISGKITALQAKIEKAKRFDLNSKSHAIGKKVFNQSLAIEGTEHLQSDIAKIDRELVDLAKDEPLDSQASFSERSKHQAIKAKRGVQAESLKVKRKSKLVEIGDIVAAADQTYSGLENEIHEYQAVREEISAMEKELEGLRSSVKGVFARPGRIIAALVIIALLIGVKNVVEPKYHLWKARAKNEQAMQESQAHLARLEAETAEMELRAKQEQEKAKREYEIIQAELKQEEARRKIKREEQELVARMEREEKRLADQKAEEEKRLAEQRERELEREHAVREYEAKQAEEQRIAQEERGEAAREYLGSVPLVPNVRLSSKVRRSGASFKIQGKNYEDILTAQNNENWLEMLSLLSDEKYEEYPNVGTLKWRASDLMRSYDFNLLVSNYRVRSNEKLFYIRVLDKGGVHWSISWKDHPDGKGMYHTWQPKDGAIFVVVGDAWELRKHLRSIDEKRGQEAKAIKEKIQLGEYTNAQAEREYEKLKGRTHKVLSKW